MPHNSYIPHTCTALIMTLMLSLSGCWDSATACGTDQDCFLGEICQSGSCTPHSDHNATMCASDQEPNTTMHMCALIDPTCPAEAPSRCEGVCVQTHTNTSHCGTCTNICAPGAVCDQGTCRTIQDCRTEPCVGQTWCNKDTGVCEPGCEKDEQCGAHGTCLVQEHSCVCAPSHHRCGDTCSDDKDPNSCGDRCTPCPGTEHGEAVCTNDGSCDVACAQGFTHCSGSCSACPQGEGIASTGCEDKACVIKSCAAGYLLCNGSCSKCPDAQGMSLGCMQEQCILTDCQPNTLACNGACRTCPQDPNGTHACEKDRCISQCNDGHKLCGQKCSTCPTGPNVIATGCSDRTQKCVATQCTQGTVTCATGCCVITPAAAGIVDHMDAAFHNGIGVDARGIPYIVYSTDHEHNGKLKLAHWDGVSAWNFDVVDTNAVAGGPKSIAVSAKGHVHLVYKNAATHTIMYATNTSGTWVKDKVQTNNNANYNDLSIKLDAQGQPRIALSYQTAVKYGFIRQGRWTMETVANSINSEFGGVDIGFLNSTSPRITYGDGTSVFYARRIASVWRTNALIGNRMGPIKAKHTSLLFNSQGNPSVFFDNTDNNSLEAIIFTTLSWTRTPVSNDINPSHDEGLGHAVMDKTNDITHVTYINRKNNQFTHLIFNKMSTKTQAIASWNNFKGTRPSVTLGPDRKAYISYARRPNAHTPTPRLHLYRQN